MLIKPEVVVSLHQITHYCCERITQTAFELAMARRQRVAFVHKTNALKLGDGMFMDECRKIAGAFPSVEADDVVVDAMLVHLVGAPEHIDLITKTNTFGDILFDLTAELSDSLGLGGSLNGAARHRQPPVSGAFGQRRSQHAILDAAARRDTAVSDTIAARKTTSEIGGHLGTWSAT